MKFQKISLLAVASLLSASTMAGNYVFVPADDSVGTQICVAAAENNVSKLKDKISKVPIITKFESKKLSVIAKNQNCNDVNIVKFAQMYDANDTTKALAKYLHRTVTVRQDITSVDKAFPKVASNKPQIIVISGK
ncbi:DUF3718 domain-containing protein [Aliikangiella sp. G2MR2-5]|uniref:DUF3718 domain-containing protein n=1 Tax=Aliikangiella sp. G2MR2-5 TaxID=2788943 RepID=UPI0018AB9B78|nr:DUF3718 domain-containing protein [Aliikangiella sp. G2MR2-5]